MVRGLDKFREFFSGMEKNYIIIGGLSGTWWQSNTNKYL